LVSDNACVPRVALGFATHDPLPRTIHSDAGDVDELLSGRDQHRTQHGCDPTDQIDTNRSFTLECPKIRCHSLYGFGIVFHTATDQGLAMFIESDNPVDVLGDIYADRDAHD
jgi:hypothetical protein